MTNLVEIIGVGLLLAMTCAVAIVAGHLEVLTRRVERLEGDDETPQSKTILRNQLAEALTKIAMQKKAGK